VQDLFTTYGGEMKQTWGVSVAEIQKAIPFGVRKVNIDTDLRLAMAGTIRKNFQGTARQLRPAPLPEAGNRPDGRGLQGALRSLPHGWQGLQHPRQAAARYGKKLR
jgi:hypothetical protein